MQGTLKVRESPAAAIVASAYVEAGGFSSSKLVSKCGVKTTKDYSKLVWILLPVNVTSWSQTKLVSSG